MAVSERFDPDLLDEREPFEVDSQMSHLFKHPRLGLDDIREVWLSDPLFYPAKSPAHWLMCAEISAECLSFRWPLPATAIRAAAVPSVATKPLPGWRPSTGGIDDRRADDS